MKLGAVHSPASRTDWCRILRPTQSISFGTKRRSVYDCVKQRSGASIPSVQPRLILLLPVFDGGQRLARCLQSIEPVLDCFDMIVISLNGKNPDNDKLIISESRIQHPKLVVLETKQERSLGSHFAFIARSLRRRLSKHDHVFFLGHDDAVNEPGLRAWTQSRPPNWNRLAWIGDYVTLDENCSSQTPFLQKTISQSAKLPLDLETWLCENMSDNRRHVFTNISGMSVPFNAFLSVANYMRFVRTNYAARLEYLLVASRKCAGISARRPHVVIVFQHESQAGRRVPPSAYALDEARYRIWLLINSKTMPELILTVKSHYSIVSVPKLLLKALLFAGRR